MFDRNGYEKRKCTNRVAGKVCGDLKTLQNDCPDSLSIQQIMGHADLHDPEWPSPDSMASSANSSAKRPKNSHSDPTPENESATSLRKFDHVHPAKFTSV